MTISVILSNFEPAKIKPLSIFPFTELIRASDMQNGVFFGSHVRKQLIHLFDGILDFLIFYNKLFLIILPGNPAGLSIMVKSFSFEAIINSLYFISASHS